MQIHVVKYRESLKLLSHRYGVSVDRIADVNRLSEPNRLVVGQALVIPTPEGRHIVQPGESLWIIARKYGITLQALTQLNRIADSLLIYPGQTLRLPQVTKTSIEVNAYLEDMQSTGQQIVKSIGDSLTYLSPFSYRVQLDGEITPLNDANVFETACSKDAMPLMVITNFTEGDLKSEIAHEVLTNHDVQDRLVANILNKMKSVRYLGLNIDFEYVFPSDREHYNQFLRRLAGELRPEGFLLSSALAPKKSSDKKGLLYEAHDYKEHGRILDFTILMTYEWGWAGGPPMAVAPIHMVKKVLDYAVSVIPRSKIVMGMPLYSYDWTLPYVKGESSWAPAISPQEAIERAVKYHAVIEYDPVSQSPYFYYSDEQQRKHVVWFEDARSVQAKLTMVKEYNLRGISYWVLGYPFPQNWLLLEECFQIKKLR